MTAGDDAIRGMVLRRLDRARESGCTVGVYDQEAFVLLDALRVAEEQLALLRSRLGERLTMAREVLEAKGLGHVAALVPIEEVLAWMDEGKATAAPPSPAGPQPQPRPWSPTIDLGLGRSLVQVGWLDDDIDMVHPLNSGHGGDLRPDGCECRPVYVLSTVGGAS